MMRIAPLGRKLDASLGVPGSKSISQRALLAAALADGESTLTGPLDSEDTRYLRSALRQMGVAIDDSRPDAWRVRGCGGRITAPEAPIFLGNNGTATRFLTSLAALAHGPVRITGDERMAERPIQPLLDALSGWGADIQSERGNGCPPLSLQANGLRGGLATLAPGRSSQYLSSLLLVAPYAASRAEIQVQGELYSRPYVEMTVAVMRAFGVEMEASARLDHFAVSPQSTRGYQPRHYAIEGDASSASYFLAAAAICGGRVCVENLPSPSLQGDARFAELLARMGCQVERGKGGIVVSSAGPLQAICADMGDMPDVAPTLAVVAAFAGGETHIQNIAHLRVKECDRVSAMAKELAALGVRVREEDAALHIMGAGKEGNTLHAARIHTYRDHRIAMSLALAGLRIPGVEIEDGACVAKSFPDFWERFQQLTGQV